MCAKNSEVSEFSAIAGYGVRANIKVRTIYVGKQGLFEKFGQEIQYHPQFESLRKEGKAIVFVGTEETIDGVIAIRDETRSQSKRL
ncbi:MAG: hypothetical protein NC830_00200 [Candidatus Omnitrophica bacterium]|nr:hypothetical protein [Candidatus Omnitrophota bacterium]